MKKIVLLVGAVALFGAGCEPYVSPGESPAPMPPAAQPTTQMPVRGAPTPKPVTANVQIKDTAFSPLQLAINPGDTVLWTNVGKSNHTVTGIGAVLLWDSGNLKPGQTFKHTFPEPGVYQYHDAINPKLTGEIIVGEVQPQTR